MKILVQRIKKAELNIVQDRILTKKGSILKGLLVYVSIEKQDTQEALNYWTRKIVNLRIFSDQSGRMQDSIQDKDYSIMCIPNFTLAGSVKKGNRPSFDNAADKAKAACLFNQFCDRIEDYKINCVRGIFGSEMIIDSSSWGPVNIIIDNG
jgi:D-aminoacyl-tRNA deacylase